MYLSGEDECRLYLLQIVAWYRHKLGTSLPRTILAHCFCVHLRKGTSLCISDVPSHQAHIQQQALHDHHLLGLRSYPATSYISASYNAFLPTFHYNSHPCITPVGRKSNHSNSIEFSSSVVRTHRTPIAKWGVRPSMSIKKWLQLLLLECRWFLVACVARVVCWLRYGFI